ncbi:MAG: hypothetical protein IAA73_07540 [Bacteroidetes bacterium]|uniref:YopX protein domain-containing protein n=1 Tax=Candidatus Gallipaludibacter merdavium TaxID=2840839 RepID=A0A9D9HUN4_9BACT|nr:hypothetical protein [Candidatus Gallipaludibacter merdavium]
MNREIKFRGKGYSEWFYGYVQEYHEKFCKRICVCPVSIRTWKDALMYEVKEETIGQFIGLHDKNGKEIYEGDILKADYYDTLHEVVFSDTVGAFMLDEIPSTGDIVVIGYEDIVSHFEVIGNIYDNQDLLEG